MPTIVTAIPVPAAWIAAELLKRNGLEVEPTVIVELTASGPTVRKMTPAEKSEHSERTGEGAFLGSDEELSEYLELLAERSEHRG